MDAGGKKTVVHSARSTGRAVVSEGLSAADKKLLLWMGLILAVGVSLLSWAIVGHWLGAFLWVVYLPPFWFGMSECSCAEEDTVQDRLEEAAAAAAPASAAQAVGQVASGR